MSRIPGVLFHVSCNAKDDWLLAVVPPAVFLIAVKNAAGAAALARACARSRSLPPTSRAWNLTQLLLPLHTFAFLNRPEVSAVRGAKVRRLCRHRVFTDPLARGVSTILREILIPTSSYIARTYDCIDAGD